MTFARSTSALQTDRKKQKLFCDPGHILPPHPQISLDSFFSTKLPKNEANPTRRWCWLEVFDRALDAPSCGLQLERSHLMWKEHRMRARVRSVWMVNMRSGERVSTTMTTNHSECAHVVSVPCSTWACVTSPKRMRTQKCFRLLSHDLLYANRQNQSHQIESTTSTSSRTEPSYIDPAIFRLREKFCRRLVMGETSNILRSMIPRCFVVWISLTHDVVFFILLLSLESE